MSLRIRLKQYNALVLNKDGAVSGARLIYHVNDLGASTAADILKAVRTFAAATIEASTRDTVEMVDLPHADCCDVAVNYVETVKSYSFNAKAKRRSGDTFWSFDTAEGEVLATTALEQVATVDESTGQFFAGNVGNMIGWNGKLGAESACAGVGVGTPVTRLNCRRTLAASTAQAAGFAATIMNLQRKVNSAAFHGYAAGEVRFLGASIGETYMNDSGAELTDVNYVFAVKKNEDAKTIGAVTIPAKNGWDYAWTITAPGTQDKLETVFGCVSRVYEYADLSGLGI